MKTPANPKPLSVRESAARLALGYGLVGILWILFSSHVVSILAPNAQIQTVLEEIKGWLFILATALGLYYVVYRMLKKVHDLDTRISRQSEEHQLELERYRLLLEASGDSIVLLDPEKRYRAVPPRLAALFGMTPDEIVGRKLRDVLGPDQGPLVEQAVDEVLRTRKIYQIEREITTPQGPRWIDSVYSPMIGDNGEIAAIMAVSRDVTDKVAAIDQLRQRTEQYKILLDTISLIGQTLRLSEVVDSILRRMQIIDCDHIDVFLCEDARLKCIATSTPDTRSLVGKSIVKGENPLIQQLIERQELVTSNGRLYPWDDANNAASWMFAPLIVRTQLIGALVFIRNMPFTYSERESALAFARSAAVSISNAQLYEHLERSEADYRQLVNSVDDMIYHTDVQGNQIFVNSKGREVQQLEESDSGTGPWLPFIHPDDITQTVAAFQQQLTTGDTVHFENRVVGKQGRVTYMSHLARAIRDESGVIVGVFGIGRDMTEKKHVEQVLETRARQQAGVAALGQHALVSTDLPSLMNEAVILVTQTLNMEFCDILELSPDGNTLFLRAGAGWKAGYVGQTKVSAGRDSQAGYTLLAKEPVVVEDLQQETRFSISSLLSDHRVVSGLSVVIEGQNEPFGVLGVHSASRRAFSKDDAYFLQTIANILAAAIGRKRAEDALRDSESRNRAIVDTAADAIITIDEQGTIESFNRAAEHLFAYTSGDVIGKNIKMLMPPAFHAQHDAYLSNYVSASATTSSTDLHLAGQCKDGTTFSTDVAISEMRLADRRMFTEIVRDITEQLQATQAAERHSRQLSIINRVFQVASEPIGLERVLDALLSEICEVFNADAMDIHLADTDAGLLYLLAHRGYDLSEHEKYQHLSIDDSLRGTALKEGHVVSYTAPFPPQAKLPHGHLDELKSIAVTPLWARGNILGTLAVLNWHEHGFTEEEVALLEALGRGVGITIENARLYAEAQSYAETLRLKVQERTDELQKALVHAQSADRMKSALLSTVSHEMRTPLSSIIGFSNLILSRKPETEKVIEYTSAINAEARRLADLINDFLDLQRIESGREVFHYTQVDLAELARDIVRKLQLNDNDSHSIRLELADVPKVYADGNRMRQVMLNLLSNALKYSPNGGEVIIALKRKAGEEIFSIRDDGLGIAPGDLNRIFDHFYRGDAAERHRIRGTGLGLGLCREIIQHHNGRIWAESAGLNKGSVFYFALPVPQPTTHTEGIPEQSTVDKFIVMVEDDLSFSSYIRERLEPEGYLVHVVDFAAATPALMTKLNPALIILDILKAEEQVGWPLLAELKQNSETSTIPVIVCSVLNNPDKARKLGASSYISKPVDEAFLIGEVSRLSKAHRQHVLIADDESITRLMLRDILVMDGYHVETVTDGAGAIEALKQKWPDLIILDLLMPNLNGFAVLEWIRMDQHNIDLPVIVLTAAELTPAEREKVVKYASAYTVKSHTSPQQLLDLVKQAIAVES